MDRDSRNRSSRSIGVTSADDSPSTNPARQVSPRCSMRRIRARASAREIAPSTIAAATRAPSDVARTWPSRASCNPPVHPPADQPAR